MTDQLDTRVTRLEEKVISLRTDANANEREQKEFEREVKANYVTKTELGPIAKLVYGVVSLILTAVICAVVALVVGKGG